MKELQVIEQALEKANQKGSFSLQESSIVFGNLINLKQEIERLQKFEAANTIDKDDSKILKKGK